MASIKIGAGLVFLATATAWAQLPPDPVVAKVGEVEVHQQEVAVLLDLLGAEAKAYYERERNLEPLLEELASRIRLAGEAERLGLDRRPDIAAKIKMDRYSTLLSAYIDDVVSVEVVPESAVRALFDQRQGELKAGEKWHARQILVTPKAESQITNRLGDDARSDDDARRKIDFVFARLKAGVDFAELAMDLSEDETAPNGGDLGWFEAGTMVPQFETAVKNLSPGQVSAVVKSEDGFHIAQLIEKKGAGPASYEDVRHKLREELMSRSKNEILERVRKVATDLAKTQPLVMYEMAPPAAE